MPTKSQRRKALTELPPDLFGAFRGIINRIRECPRTSHAELGLRVLMWLHFAYRPLNLVELQHALAVEIGHTEFDKDNIPSQEVLLDCCLGLVVVDKETSTVRFVHYTLEEYFRKYTTEEFPNGCSSIAETCLTYLNFGGLKHPCESLDSLECKLLEYALLDYAALNWGNYFKQQCQYNDDLVRLAIVLLDHENECPPCAIQALYQKTKSYYYSVQPTIVCPLRFSGIHVIAYFGLSETMAYLCKEGRDVELKDEDGRTPLSWAAAEGHEGVVRILIKQHDVDINANDEGGQTPLSWAAKNGHEAVVRLLVERNDIDINAKGKYGRTPLLWAAKNGHEAVVRLLVERKDIDINAKVLRGYTNIRQYNVSLLRHMLIPKQYKSNT